jgi:hypothetical protein
MEHQAGNQHRPGPYKDYLRWLHQNSRVSIRPAFTDEYIADTPASDDDADIVDDYDTVTRQGWQPERAPIQNYMVG